MPATHHPYSPTWMKLSDSEMPATHHPYSPTWMKLSDSEMPATQCTHHSYSPTWMKLSGSEMPFLHQPKPYLKDQFLKCPLSHQPYSPTWMRRSGSEKPLLSIPPSPTWMRRSGSEKPLLRIPPCSQVGSPSKIHNCYRARQEKIYNKNLKGWGKKWHSGRRDGEVNITIKIKIIRQNEEIETILYRSWKVRRI